MREGGGEGRGCRLRWNGLIWMRKCGMAWRMKDLGWGW